MRPCNKGAVRDFWDMLNLLLELSNSNLITPLQLHENIDRQTIPCFLHIDINGVPSDEPGAFQPFDTAAYRRWGEAHRVRVRSTLNRESRARVRRILLSISSIIVSIL